MYQRRRLTLAEREAAAAQSRAEQPGRDVFVQEWTNADGKAIIVNIINRLE